MLQKKIKASAITNLTDARYFAAWEVEWLSFSFEEGTAAYIEPSKMKAIREWVDGVKIIGEFPKQTAAEIKEWAKLLDLSWLQVSSAVSATELKQLEAYQLIQEVIILPSTTFEQVQAHLEQYKEEVVYFQLNFEQNGIAWETLANSSGFSRAQLKELCERYSIILSIGFQPTNLQELSSFLPYEALNLQGGEEEKVGFKSFDDLDAILEQLEVEE